jgi:hypothetical protein
MGCCDVFIFICGLFHIVYTRAYRGYISGNSMEISNYSNLGVVSYDIDDDSDYYDSLVPDVEG